VISNTWRVYAKTKENLLLGTQLKNHHLPQAWVSDYRMPRKEHGYCASGRIKGDQIVYQTLKKEIGRNPILIKPLHPLLS